ncbi:sugar kinase [Streptomyces sp. NPDC020983]|uniref:sugar kinase n=1 Tax=Streptomyces sp. NPDC020983 TaxID=3365106 RepID=UPI00379306D7
MTEVLTFGEAMASLRTPGPLRLGGAAQLSVAGSESNVAIGLARLGHDVAWAGVVGDDEPGALVRRTLRAEGVGTRFVRTAAGAFTGFVAFDRPAYDITRVSYHRAGSAGSTLTADECVAALTAAAPALLHLTGITPALSPTAREATLTAARTARAAGVRVTFDVNHRARLWSRAQAEPVLRELIASVDTVFASEDELPLLSPSADPAADLLARGVAEVVVTAGAAGARCHTPDGTVSRPALPVTVVDSVGAGDAFVSGYLSAVLDALPPQDRLTRATASGAFCVGGRGDWESLPTRDDLALLARGPGHAAR